MRPSDRANNRIIIIENVNINRQKLTKPKTKRLLHLLENKRPRFTERNRNSHLVISLERMKAIHDRAGTNRIAVVSQLWMTYTIGMIAIGKPRTPKSCVRFRCSNRLWQWQRSFIPKLRKVADLIFDGCDGFLLSGFL